MPSKAQRAASRQARLSRRRRRGKAAPQNFQAGPLQPSAVAEADEAEAPRRAVRTPAVDQTAVATPSNARTALRSRRRAAEVGSVNAYRYLGRELRQIGAISTLIIAILAGLTFVLG